MKSPLVVDTNKERFDKIHQTLKNFFSTPHIFGEPKFKEDIEQHPIRGTEYHLYLEYEETDVWIKDLKIFLWGFFSGYRECQKEQSQLTATTK